MNRVLKYLVLAALSTTAVGTTTARADVQVFVNQFVDWLIAAQAPIRSVDFRTLPNGMPSQGGEPITPVFNYTHLGVMFSPPHPVDFFGIGGNPTGGFDLTSFINHPLGRAWIIADLVRPTNAAGAFFPGNTTVSIFDTQGILLGSQSFAGAGGSFFIGFVSDTPIARTTIDRGSSAEGIEAFVFNPIPEPGTLLLASMVGLFLARRRQLRRRTHHRLAGLL